MIRVFLAIFILSVSLFSHASVPAGDTSGTVEAVRVKHTGSGALSFQIWFSTHDQDRWECLKNDGYITVSDQAETVSIESLKLMFSVALAAQVSGKKLALDSSGTNPCVSVNQAWMIN